MTVNLLLKILAGLRGDISFDLLPRGFRLECSSIKQVSFRFTSIHWLFTDLCGRVLKFAQPGPLIPMDFKGHSPQPRIYLDVARGAAKGLAITIATGFIGEVIIVELGAKIDDILPRFAGIERTNRIINTRTRRENRLLFGVCGHGLA